MLKCGIAIEDIGLRIRCDRMLEVAHFVFRGNQVCRRAKAFFEDGGSLVKIRNLVECADLEAGLS